MYYIIIEIYGGANILNKDLTLAEMLEFIKKNIVVIIVTAIAFAIITFIVSSALATTTYSYKCEYISETLWYEEEEVLTPSGAFSAANYAVYAINTQKKLLRGSALLNAAIEDAGYKGQISSGNFNSMISLSSEEDTLILSVTFSSTDKEAIRKLAESYAKLAPEYANMNYSSLEIFEPVAYAGSSSTPVPLYTFTAFVLGGLIALVLLYFIESLDNRIKSSAEVENKYGIVNLGIIPNLYVSGGKNYKAYKKGAKGNYEAYAD